MSPTFIALDVDPAITPFIATPLWILVSISLLTHSRHARSVSSILLISLLCVSLVSFSVLSSPPTRERRTLHTTVRLPLSRQDDGNPNIPPIDGAAPSPAPSASAAPSPPASPPPSPSPPMVPPPSSDTMPVVPTTPIPVQQTAGLRPERSRCSAGLRRMQAILLLELCFEFLFLFIACIADRSLVDPPVSGERRNVDISFRGYLFIRAIYAVPVLILNCSIYWIGGGPTGSCLSSYSEVQIAFAHLIFYLLFCVFVIVIGIYRIDLYDSKEQSAAAASVSYAPTSQSNGGAGPPTRTESYFHSMNRRRRNGAEGGGGGGVDSQGYEIPKFRFNLGCCAINF